MMNHEIEQHHELDDKGNPAGGLTTGRGFEIHWQNGPLGKHGPNCGPGLPCGGPCTRVAPNGAFVEGVILAAIGRLEFYNTTKFKCRENSLAITKLQEALHWLNDRTAQREARGVEGTHEV